MRSGLGDKDVDLLFHVYPGTHSPQEADLVTYWFGKACTQVTTEPGPSGSRNSWRLTRSRAVPIATFLISLQPEA